MIVNGMWFQDAFNYDFSGICNSTTPVATTQGEISFCAYYGGGWRKVVEHQSRTATLAEWHRTYGRHEIYANGKNVDLGQPAQGAGPQLIQIEPEPPAVRTAGRSGTTFINWVAAPGTICTSTNHCPCALLP